MFDATAVAMLARLYLVLCTDQPSTEYERRMNLEAPVSRPVVTPGPVIFSDDCKPVRPKGGG